MGEPFEDGALACARPSQWKADPGLWTSWFDGVLELIGENIWPIRRAGAWDSTPAAAGAIEMTRADLESMGDFRALHRLAFVGTTGLYHAHLMTLEDGADWTRSIQAYCPDLADPARNLDSVVKDGLISYLGQFTTVAFKARFQRPRAYQAALLLEPGRKFRCDTVTTADTPSLISGHAVQGLIVGCTILEAIRADEGLARRNHEGLKAWMTGIGDRRVMAGVHYPTDSLASWIVAAELVDYVFAEPVIREFLREAIRGSLLYKFMESRLAATAAHARAWSCLQATLAKPFSKVSTRGPAAP